MKTLFWIGISVTIGCYAVITVIAAPFDERPPIPEELLSVIAGNVFEIIAVSDVPLPNHSWILTLDRQFLQAGQTAVFRKRFLQPGTYTLSAQVQSATGEIFQRTMRISVTPRSTAFQENGTEVVPEKANVNTIVDITPPPNSLNRIVVPSTKRILLITPTRKSLALDLLPSIDTDNDHIPQNDRDTHDTFFEEEGSPLYLWLASPLTEKAFLVHDTVAQDIPPQLLQIISIEHAQTRGMLTGEIHISHKEQDDGSIAFSIMFEGDTHPDVPILYEWDFGDGEKSLMDAPVHTFAKTGTYDVKAEIRNLETNEHIARTSTALSVTVTIPPEESPPPEEAEDIPPPPPSKKSTALFSMAGISIGILFGIIILGTGVFFILKKIKGGRSTSEITQKLEENILKEKEEEPKGFPVDHEEEKKEPETKKEEAEEPSWLKKEEGKESPTVTGAAVVPPWLGGSKKVEKVTKAPPPPPVKPIAPPPVVHPPDDYRASKPPIPPQPTVPTKTTVPSPSEAKEANVANEAKETPIAFVKVDSIKPLPPTKLPAPPPQPSLPPKTSEIPKTSTASPPSPPLPPLPPKTSEENKPWI